MKDVQYMSNVNYMPSVSFMKDIQPMASVTGLQDVTPFASIIKPYTPRKLYTVDDSTEKAKSLLDVLLGNDQRNKLMEEEGLNWLKDVPILNLVGGTAALVKDKYVDPFIENGISGQTFKEIGLNTITEVAEDLDILSNIIKSQNPAAGGEFLSLKTLGDSLGVNGKRVVYNFNTGNTIEDIIAEIISDPLTVLTLGASAVESIGKAGAKSAATVVTKEVVSELSEQATKDFAKAVTKTVVKEGKEATFENILKNVNRRSLQEISEAGLKKATPEIVESILKSKGYQYFAQASKLKASVNTVDTAITKTAWMMTPVGLPAKYAKPVIKEAVGHIYSNLMSKLQQYDLTKNFVKKQGAFKEALATAMLQNKAINETIFKNNIDFLRRIGADEVKLQQYMYTLLKQIERSGREVDIYEAFIDYLTKHNEKFTVLYKTDNLFKEYIESEAFKELIDVTKVAPDAIMMAEKQLSNSYHQATYNSMKKYIDSNKNNLEVMYNYIDNNVLNYNGKHFGLKDLDGFLKEMITNKTTSKDYTMKIATLLESVGINRNNAANIEKILKSSIKDKNKAIMKILEQSNNIKLLNFEDYNKLFTKVSNQINDNTGSALNKVWKEDVATHNVKQYKSVIDSSIKTMKDAVNRIKGDVDVQRALDYIHNVVRLEDMPEFEATLNLIENAIKDNPSLLDPKVTKLTKEHLTKLDNFFKETDRIMSKMEKDPSVAFDIPKWYASMEDIQNTIDTIQTAFTTHGGPAAVKPRERLYRIQQALETFTKAEITDALVNYVDNVNGLVQTQLSHLGMFNILTQHTHLSGDKNMKFFLEQMANKDSIYRQQIIPNLVEALNKANMPEVAKDIQRVVAQIDTVTNLNQLLITEVPTSFKMSNKLQEDIRNIIFDTIDNHKTYLIADIYSDDVTSRSYSEWLADKEARTLRQILYDDLDKHIDTTKTVRERLFKETVGINQDAVVKEVKEQMHYLLDDYINKQALIGNYIDNVSLSTLYDLNTVKTLELTAKIRFDMARNTEITAELLNDYDTIMREFYQFGEAIQMGIDEIQKINKQLEIPLSSYDATKQLRKVIESYNLYSGSIESSMFAAKYLIQNSYDAGDKHIAGLIETYKLPTEAFTGSNEEYLMLTERLWAYRDVLHEEFKYQNDYIERLRNCLIDTYSRPNTLFAPTNPLQYFNSLEAEQLLAWEVVSKGNLSLNNKTAFYGALNKATQASDFAKVTQSDFLAKMDTVFRNIGFTDDEAVAHIASIARNANAMEYANRTIDANLMYTLHSLDDLGKYKDNVVKFLQDDVATMDDIVKTITDIENDPTLRRTFEDFGNVEDLRNLGGTNYGYEEVLFRNQETMYQERCSAKALSVANMNAEELATHIYRQTPGALVFHNAGIVKVQNVDGSVIWTGIDNIFNFTDDELKAAGLKIMKEVKEDGDWYYIRLTDNRVHEMIPRYADLGTSHRRIQQRYTDLIDKYRVRLNMWEVEDVPANILTVETLNEDTWNSFMDAYSDFFGDIEERKLYQKYTPIGNSSFFDKSYSRLNLTVVGGYDTYNAWNKTFSNDFIQRSTQMSRNTLAGLTSMVNRSNKINKYLSMFFNNDYALDSPLISKMFEGADSNKIKTFFDTGKYKVAVLRQDKKGLPRVFEYTVDSKRSLDKAIAAGGILVPTETYSAMRQVVNNRKMTNSLLDIYRRVVPSTYKSMYLFTAGFPFRNGLDSLIFKNANELGGIAELPKVFMYEREASKALNLHNKIQQEVLEATGGETFNKEMLLEVLSKHTKEDAEVYFLTDLFIESNASGGLSSSMSKYLENFNKQSTDDIRPLWEKFYENKVLFGEQKLNPLNQLRNLNNHIEQTARMGLFLASVDEGMPINDAIARVIKTHFDYNSGGDLMDICERIFWFSTFPINNFNYYVNGGLTKSPTMIKLAMDTQVASWNNGEYTYEELKKTNFLAYHALTGNIRIGNWIVKTSPSLFDFISLVTDLPGNVKDRLNPFISIATGNTEAEDILTDLNPFQTQMRLWSQYLQGNPVPSILSKINEYDWDRVRGRWRNYGQRSWTSYPRIKRPTAQIRYVRKYYSRRYRTDVRKYSRTTLFHDAINYYRLGGRRGTTYRDL